MKMSTHFLSGMLPNMYTASMLMLLALASSTMVQAKSPASLHTSCISRFEVAVAPICFTATGLNFTGVLYVISGNMSGAIPAGFTYASFLQLLCSSSSQDKIIPCVLEQMNIHNTSQCKPADRITLFGRGGQLLAFMEAICGQPCEQEGTQGLMQCFSVTGMHHERILSQNASITDDRYSMIGRNDSEIDNFCKNRHKLFFCASSLLATCPGLMQRMYAIGIDLQAMETVTEYVCSDKQKYLKSLGCFNKQSPEMTNCSQTTSSSMRAAFTGRYQTGTIIPSEYQDSLCKTKLAQMGCELAAYAKSCDVDTAFLRTSVECTMLPKPCRENSQAEYSNICQKVVASAVQKLQPNPGKQGTLSFDRLSTNFASVSGGTSDVWMVLLLLASMATLKCF